MQNARRGTTRSAVAAKVGLDTMRERAIAPYIFAIKNYLYLGKIAARKKTPPIGGVSQSQAANLMNVSQRSVTRAPIVSCWTSRRPR